MKRVHYYIIGFVLAMLLVSCHQQSFTISGALANGAGKCIYIEETTPKDGNVPVDSIVLDKEGRFRTRCTLEYASFFNLRVNEEDYIVLLPHAGERIRISGNYDDLVHSYEVSGSAESVMLWQLQDFSNRGNQELAELVKADRQNREVLSEDEYLVRKQQTDSLFLCIRNMQIQYMTDFIEEHRGSLATLIALYKPFNRHPLFPPETSIDMYQTVLEGLEECEPDNPHTINFKNTVQEVAYRYGRP